MRTGRPVCNDQQRPSLAAQTLRARESLGCETSKGRCSSAGCPPLQMPPRAVCPSAGCPPGQSTLGQTVADPSCIGPDNTSLRVMSALRLNVVLQPSNTQVFIIYTRRKTLHDVYDVF